MIQIHKKGFTLLELLVVIVIIALLLAILLPVFGRVREQGRRALCISNLRQHGIAWYLYLGDHDECFPLYSDPASDGQCNNMTFGGKIDFTRQNPAQNRPINHYLDIYDDSSSNVGIFHCPNDKEPPGPLFPYRLGTAFDDYGNSYSANWRILIYTGERRPLSTITSPYNELYLEMCCFSNYPGHGGNGWTEGKTPVMVLFMDGHVAGPFLHYEDFETGGGDKVLELP